MFLESNGGRGGAERGSSPTLSIVPALKPPNRVGSQNVSFLPQRGPYTFEFTSPLASYGQNVG